jgi:hypothetical protein
MIIFAMLGALTLACSLFAGYDRHERHKHKNQIRS